MTERKGWIITLRVARPRILGEGGNLGPSPWYGAVNECEGKKDEMVEESKKKKKKLDIENTWYN